MIRSFFIHLGLIALFLSTTLVCLFNLELAFLAVPASLKSPQPIGAVLLIPLDSRPPCTDYVRKLGRMAGHKIILPPVELLDNYRLPSNTTALQEWFQHEIAQAESAIISVDMLIHGGLWASRQGHATTENADEVLQLLTTIHQRNPQVKLYAFSIIPRLFIAENSITEKYRKSMAEWSILQETLLLFENPRDYNRLQQLDQDLPRELVEQYRNLYIANRNLNLRLFQLIREGVLSGLVIGQDDSAPFGVGNLERHRLEMLVEKNPELQDKVFITRGTDEVALNMLGQATCPSRNYKTKVYVFYTEPHTAESILPYMPGPLSLTVAEKLQIIGTETVGRIEDADYILAIHAGNAQSQQKQLSKAASQIKDWLENDKNVALVDLAADWKQNQTLLPLLHSNGTPLHQLIAYAGWNTASNSIGTAVTQASMVLAGRSASDIPTLLSRDLDRIGFLAERILDDWHYQKNYRFSLNEALLRQSISPYDLAEARAKTTRKIQNELSDSFVRLIIRDWRNAKMNLQSIPPTAFSIADWEIQSGLPWDRTFEIRLDLKATPALIKHLHAP